MFESGVILTVSRGQGQKLGIAHIYLPWGGRGDFVSGKIYGPDLSISLYDLVLSLCTCGDSLLAADVFHKESLGPLQVCSCGVSVWSARFEYFIYTDDNGEFNFTQDCTPSFCGDAALLPQVGGLGSGNQP